MTTRGPNPRFVHHCTKYPHILNYMLHCVQRLHRDLKSQTKIKHHHNDILKRKQYKYLSIFKNEFVNH